MKRKLLYIIVTVVALLCFPKLNYGQAPNLGTAAKFVLFSTNGAVTNAGTEYLTHLTGNIGMNVGSLTGFGNVDGQMHPGGPVSQQCSADLGLAWLQLGAAIPNYFPAPLLGNGTTLTPGVYSIPSSAVLNLDLILDGQGDPNAVFIFQIGGTFNTNANAKVKLVNDALACNVFWKVDGAVTLATGTSFKGTIAADGAINLSTGDTLEGRALSISGAVGVSATMAYTPIGCGSPTLTGPGAPTLAAIECYALFSSDGPVTDNLSSFVGGDVGTNNGSATGWDPLKVDGDIHNGQDPSTIAAAVALQNAYDYLNGLTEDIILIRPDLFGHNLVLTPHTYLMDGAVTFTDTLYLNALDNPDAVFVIQAEGAFETSTNSRIVLINGAQAKNVYWLFNGAVDINGNSIFNGTIVSYGAVNIQSGTVVNGRALTVVGALNTYSIEINITSGISGPAGNISGTSTVCQGQTGVIYSVPEIEEAIDYNWSLPSGATITAGVNTDSITVSFSNIAQSGNITVQGNGNCKSGTISSIFPVVVNEPANVNTIPNQTVCSNTRTDTVIFTGTVSGSTYSWINNNTSIGLAASGNGNINPFTAINNGILAQVATITVTPTAKGCVGADSSFTITVNPTPTVDSTPNQAICNGTPTLPVIFTGNTVGATYNWTNNTTSIGLAASGNGPINSFTATNAGANTVTATITVTPNANGCDGADSSFTITVYPTPIVNSIPDQVLCNSTPTAAVIFSGAGAGATYNWTNNQPIIGLAPLGSGNINSFNATNPTPNPIVATITVSATANGCIGPDSSFTITVNPGPTVNTVANQAICNNDSTAAVTFSGAGNGATYSWSNNNTSIGLAASGNGDIASFQGTNTGNNAVIATIVATSTANGCTGQTSFSITVNPTPKVNSVPNQTVCNNTSTSAINFSSATTGATYTWTNNNTAIGLAASGNGNIAPFTATNSGSTPISAQITVTPTANGCIGVDSNFTITVVSPPVANAVTNQTLCNSTPTTAIVFAGAGVGAVYNWTNNTPSIGLAANGSGNINSFTAINTTGSAVTATLTVTPTNGNCAGTVNSFTITVNPGPTVNAVSNQVVCNNASTTAITFSGAGIGATYSWTNSTPSIGLAASGTGNIAAFTASNNGSSPITAAIIATSTASGCTGQSSFTINVQPTPTVVAVSNKSICANTYSADIIFSGAVSGTVYEWTNSNTAIGLDSNGSGNIPSFLVGNVGTMATIVVTPTTNLCNGSAISYTIEAKDCSIIDFHIPEGFSPDGDRINDLFVVRGIERFTNNTLTIFNRWGDKMFEATPYKNTWNGDSQTGVRVGGVALPTGTYFYVLDLGDGTAIYKGIVYLNR